MLQSRALGFVHRFAPGKIACVSSTEHFKPTTAHLYTLQAKLVFVFMDNIGRLHTYKMCPHPTAPVIYSYILSSLQGKHSATQGVLFALVQAPL